MTLPLWLIIVCLMPLFIILIIILAKNTFLFPYILLALILLESFPLFRIASNAMGDYLSLPRIVIFVLILSLLFAQKNKPKFKYQKVILIAFIFVIYFTTSILWSVNPIIDFPKLMTFPMLFITLWIVARITEDWRNRQHFINAMALMGLFISLFSVLAFLGIGYAGRYGLSDPIIRLVRTRPFNLNSNFASFYISICSIPIIISFLYKTPIWKKVPNHLMIMLVIFNFTGLLATGSMSGVILFLMILIISYIFSPAVSRKVTLSISAGILIIMVSFFNLRNDFIENILLRRYQIETQVVGQDKEFLGGSYGGRGEYWSDAYDIFLSNPIVGSGLSSYRYITGASTHNDIFWALSEGGLIGLILWISLFYYSMKISIHIRKISNRYRDVYLLFWSNLFIVFVICSFAYSQLHAVHTNKLFWVFLGLIVGTSGVAKEKYYTAKQIKTEQP